MDGTRASGITRVALLLSIELASPGCADGHDLPPSSRGSFTLQVLAPAPAGSEALPGAVVALDTAAGTRVEATTDASGTATFDNVDFTSGAFSFTVAAAGYIAVTNDGLRDTTGWTITLQPSGQDEGWVDVSGAVLGKSDPDHFIVVTSTAPSSFFSGVGPDYAIRVAPGVATSFIVVEDSFGAAPTTTDAENVDFTSWTQFSLGSLTGPTSLDLALPGSTSAPGSASVGTSLSPTLASGTMTLPASMIDAAGHAFVSLQSNGNAFLGGIQQVSFAAGNLAYTLQYVSPLGAAALTTTYWLTSNDRATYAVQDGTPGGDLAFLEPPSIASPLPMYGDFAVTSPSSSTYWVRILRDDASTGWLIYEAGAPGGPLHMPRLPSGIDPRLVLGTGRVSAMPVACEVPPGETLCARYATGAPADLVSP